MTSPSLTPEQVIQELEEALRNMTNVFSAFSSKPIGSPYSPARLNQEQQIAASAKAHSALSRAKAYREQGER
jgi:hypothetical protein